MTRSCLVILALVVFYHPRVQADEAASASRPAASEPVDTSPQVVEAIVKAPVEAVWKVWTTAEGFKAIGVAHAEVDLRVGGLMRTHYDPKGVLGDEGTIENKIIAYEPLRMLAVRIHKPPAKFPFKTAWRDTWTVVTLTDLGDGRTHVRCAGIGYTADPESQAMRRFFKMGNDFTLKKLQAHFDSSAGAAVPARAHAENPLAPIVIETVVAAPREDVWRWVSTAKGWKEFMGIAAARIELRPSGPWEIQFGADAPKGQRGSEGCTTLAVDAPNMVSFTWNAPPKFAHARAQRTWVILTLESVGPKMTRVRLKHQGFAEQAAAHADHAEEWKTVRGYFAQAWGRVLEELAKHAQAPAGDGSTKG